MKKKKEIQFFLDEDPKFAKYSCSRCGNKHCICYFSEKKDDMVIYECICGDTCGNVFSIELNIQSDTKTTLEKIKPMLDSVENRLEEKDKEVFRRCTQQFRI